ncbi:MAG: sigma-70 family RNA polymerase sigma factor [Actinomycetota bacterium]
MRRNRGGAGAVATGDDLDELLALAALGDEAAVVEVCRALLPIGTQYAERRGARDAEAIANAAVLSTVRVVPNLRVASAATVRAYLFRSIRNQLIDDARRQARSTPTLERMEPAPSAEEALVSDAGFEELLALLSPPQRDVIAYRFRDGLSTREIASEMGRSPGAVRQLQAQGLKRLRLLLAGVVVILLIVAGVIAGRQPLERVEIVDVPPGPVDIESDEQGQPTPDEQVTTDDAPPLPRQSADGPTPTSVPEPDRQPAPTVADSITDGDSTADGDVITPSTVAPAFAASSGMLRNEASGLCVSVLPSTNLELQPCDAANALVFAAELHETDDAEPAADPLAPSHLVVATERNMCLDRSVASTADDTNVIVYPCHGYTHQQWRLAVAPAGGITLRNAGLDICLQPSGGSPAPGTRLVVAACDDARHQAWNLV